MIKSTSTPKMKSIIVSALLLPLVLATTSQDDFMFLDANDDSSLSLLKNPTSVSSKNYAEQPQPNVGHLVDERAKKKYIIPKNERKKKRLDGNQQRKAQKKAEKHVKKLSKNVKSKKESGKISHSKKNYAIDSFRDRREAGSGYGEEENYDLDDAYDDDDDPTYDENEPVGITDLPTIGNESKSRGFVDYNQNQNPHRHGHGDGFTGLKVDEEINEREIIPVISPRLEEGMKNITLSLSTTPAPKLTTTPQTTTQQSSTTSTTPLPTTTTLSTLTSTTPSTTTLFVLSTSPFVETTMLQSNTNNIVPLSSTTTTTTTSEETTKTDIIIPETTSMSNKIDDDDRDNTLSILTGNDNDTLSTTLLTTLVNTVSTSTEKQEINIITDEVPESTESPVTSTLSPEIILEEVETRIAVAGAENETETSTTVSTPTTTTSTTTTESTKSSVTSTTPSTTTTTTTTTSTTPEPKKIDYGVKNYPPRQERRLPKIPIVAGKLLNFNIPADTFNDIEDGDTRNLKLSLFYNGSLVNSNHWLQFNSTTQEVYGLPTENDVSTWQYVLVASDSEGLNVSDNLDIYVRQHPHSRSITYDFSIYLRFDNPKEFPTNVDWQIQVVNALANLYGNDSISNITVRSIDITSVNEVIFTWTNDTIISLRRGDCPKNEIYKLFSPLTDNDDGDPSFELQQVLSSKIHVERVILQGFEQCDILNRPEPQPATSKPKKNGYPMVRNHIDHINVTVGQLLVFKVPRDTFWDPEDGSGRNMKMSLFTSDRKSLGADYWLQFDSKNQEFYGIPLEEDLNQAGKEYQLEVTDKDGETAIDGLVVQVYPTTQKNYSIEFSMTLDVPFDSFAHSALQKRTFIEKLAKLFNDKNTSMISLKNIKKGSTVVTWRNNTLQTEQCPNNEIKRIMSVLSNSDYTVSEVVDKIMGSEFPVSQINRTPLGICLGRISDPIPTPPPSPIIPPTPQSYPDDLFIKIILPAIIIAVMLLFAGIIALVLYRRRRSGKMSICEHDDERQSFRSKGIPVIFQDELEEKPDPGNKSPVILKEEKPPLPPPEYQKSDDGADEPMLPKGNSEEPYQPPPPFARNSDNNRQNRPKPTPTYRKPPPYVPP